MWMKTDEQWSFSLEQWWAPVKTYTWTIAHLGRQKTACVCVCVGMCASLNEKKRNSKERLERQGDRNKTEGTHTHTLRRHYKVSFQRHFYTESATAIGRSAKTYSSHHYDTQFLSASLDIPSSTTCRLSLGRNAPHRRTQRLYRTQACPCDSGWTNVLWTLFSVPQCRRCLPRDVHSMRKCLFSRDMRRWCAICAQSRCPTSPRIET